MKALFSIQKIGAKRFYVSILIGIYSIFVFNELFSFGTKLARVEWNPVLGIAYGLLPYHSSNSYSVLIGLTTASFGSCFMISYG